MLTAAGPGERTREGESRRKSKRARATFSRQERVRGRRGRGGGGAGAGPHLALEVGGPATIVTGADRDRPHCLSNALLDALVELFIALPDHELTALRKSQVNREGVRYCEGVGYGW